MLDLSELLERASAGSASLALWRRLTLAIDPLAGADLARTIDALDAACERWPDALRLAPGRWLRDRIEGRPQPRLRLARALDLTLQGPLSGDRLAWTDAPELARATILRVFDDRLDDAGLARWIEGPSNPRPRELALASGLTDVSARRIVADPRAPHLERLALFRGALGPAGLQALLAAPPPRLRRLLLGRNLFGEPGARALAGPTALAHLELLDLDCNRLDGPALRALARAPLLAGVRVLNLSNNPIGAEGCAALADSPHLGRLEVLYLHGCALDDAALAPLLAAPWISGLKNLALSDNALTRAAVDRIAGRLDLGLDELDLCHNHFDPQDAAARLHAAPHTARLRRLCL